MTEAMVVVRVEVLVVLVMSPRRSPTRSIRRKEGMSRAVFEKVLLAVERKKDGVVVSC